MKETKITVFKDLFKSKDLPYIITLEKAANRIKNGTSKESVEKIRKCNDKGTYNKLKNKLPAILFNGEFEQRNADSMVNHSGLMILDYDKFPDNKTIEEHRQTLSKNKHVVLLFTSPGGKGLKVVIKIPKSDSKKHYDIFQEFNNVYHSDYFDYNNSDLCRVCFESYDPNIYINYEAEIFNPEIKDKGYTVSEKLPLLPIKDESIIIDKIMAFNWTKDFVDGEKNNYIFDLAGQFCEYGVSQSTAEGYLYNNIIIGNCKDEKGKLNAIRSAYKIRSFGSKYFEDYEKKQSVKTDLNKGKKSVMEKYEISEETYNEIKDELSIQDFWFIEEDSKGNTKIKIDALNYKLFLETNGFKKYFPNDSLKPTWVLVKSNIVTETSPEKIKDFVLQWLLHNKKLDVWSYCASFQNLFSETFLLMLESIDLLMLKDTKQTSYIAFLNGILTVTKDNIELKDYIDVEGYVWETQIIKRNFKISDNNDNDYKQFIYNISHKEPESIESVIGYLLSNYKNLMSNKAVILNDEVISENPEGGTGKGLFAQGLKQIRKTSILDGKNFDEKKSFPYQTVSQDTNILVFDDVKKNWDFESKFSLVTEGITLERKNKDAIKISVEDSPKMLISTNYAIKGEGNSHDRRRHEVEIAQYYGKDKTPFDEFQRELFSDWSTEDWNKFDNYMVYCLQGYLNTGLIKQNAKNIKLRKFIIETSMEFYEWISDKENFALNVRHTKSNMFDKFVNEYTDFRKWLTKKRFNIWVNRYANFIGCEFENGNTNGIRWFCIINKDEPLNDEIEF